MFQAVSKASGFLFYVLGSATLVFVVLVRRGFITGPDDMVLHIVDLPLAFLGVVFAGSSLYVSLARGERISLPLLLAIGIPLAVIFGTLVYFNFGFPLKITE